MSKKDKPIVTRTFCGIVFHRYEPETWRSDSGILLSRSHVGVKWSVEEHPLGMSYRGTGATIKEALENS